MMKHGLPLLVERLFYCDCICCLSVDGAIVSESEHDIHKKEVIKRII